LTWHVLGALKSNLMARADRSFSYRLIGWNPKSFWGPEVPNSTQVPNNPLYHQASPWSNYLHFHPLFKF
jgi:hypothetical protein